MNINIQTKSFYFQFPSVRNSKFRINSKKGWIIKIEDKNTNSGFGEISPIKKVDLSVCEKELKKIPNKINENILYQEIQNLHPCIQSGFNVAIAELKGNLIFHNKYPFSKLEDTAILLNSNTILEEFNKLKNSAILAKSSITIKWKVAIEENEKEEKMLENILNQIPSNMRFRIDANGSWSRKIANRWAEILKGNDNLDWLEQPLEVDDIEGLKELEKKIPTALDESLIKYPNLINEWSGWQIRRPSQEKDPLILIKELENKEKWRSISTSFETGIGRKLLNHCALLQLYGPTPKAPGLGLKQMPKSFLFNDDAIKLWEEL